MSSDDNVSSLHSLVRSYLHRAAMEVLKTLARLFYIINPYEARYEKVEHIPEPDFIDSAIPYFFTFIFLEYAIQWKKNQRKARLNDSVTSLSHGIYLGCTKILARGLESYAYIKIYENWRLYELPWDSPWTWYLAAVSVDFGYYWLHRAAHELNFFWAQHQVHHSAEDFNLSTALRQAGFQGWIGWVFYLPMAFFVPPSIFLIHQQFNLLFQFWIHTELIDNVGPLEYILNTPRHHRIHHGSNRYCLDKNYAGVLIIWDRMFGTFAAQKEGEPIIYGLVEETKSFNPFWLQIFYYPKMWNRMKEYPEWKDKLSVLLKGPGWVPGTSRLGDINGVPEVPSREKFDPKLPLWQNVYTFIHFALIVAGFELMSKASLTLSQGTVALSVTYILCTLTSLGFILEKRKVGVYTEFLRNALGIAFFVTKPIQNVFLGQVLLVVSLISASLWVVNFFLPEDQSQPKSKSKAKKSQ